MEQDNPVFIVYDGQCPFCSQYVRLLRLRTTVPSIQLIDARVENRPDLMPSDAHLDDGMLVWIGDEWYQGADAMHRLALMSSRANWFNKINYRMFKSPYLSRVFYPILRFFRNLTLLVLGREKLHR